MSPLLADGIDIPIVLVAGIIILVPLMAFEVFVEALVLKKLWRLPYRDLCGLTFSANCWSLVAGIPTKILNAFLYELLLPRDIPGFFARYPFAAVIGALIYFVVTVLVEGAYAFRWLKREQLALSRNQIWRGMLLANVVTYAVLSPLYYYGTKPNTEIREFSNDTLWTSHAATSVLFIGDPDRYLKSIQANGSGLKTVVPIPMEDYLVSTNLDLCLFRGTNGNLYFYRRNIGRTNLIWATNERFYMYQAAFSPAGERVAFASESGDWIQVMDVSSAYRVSLPLALKHTYGGLRVAWSAEETNLFIGAYNGRFDQKISINPDGTLVVSPLEGTNVPALLKCYEKTGNERWGGGGDWGVSRSRDTCGDYSAWSIPGLGSELMINRGAKGERTRVLTVSVAIGLLHLGTFYFGDVEFLEGCDECLFEASGRIYVLDINGKRLGTLAQGDQFIQLTSKDERGASE